MIATKEFVESAIWLLQLCGCHKIALNVLQEHISSPTFHNLFSGGSIGGAGGWLQIKFDSYIAMHLGKLWSSNDNRFRWIVLLSSAMQDLIVREPSLGLSVFTMMHPQNKKEWRMMKLEDNALAHPLYPSKVAESLKSITPQQSMGAVGGGSLDDVHRQLTSEEVSQASLLCPEKHHVHYPWIRAGRWLSCT